MKRCLTLPILVLLLSNPPALAHLTQQPLRRGSVASSSAGFPACEMAWVPTFGGGLDGVLGSVDALMVFDDGRGPALFVGGSFDYAGGARVNDVARWDGAAWSSVGSGVEAAEGEWSSVDAFAIFDDGLWGPVLYAGGNFSTADGEPANSIARWDGYSWSPLGDGLGGHVFALAVFDDGSGQALYAGGAFGMAGGAPAARIAKWDGSSWSSVGGGVSGGSVGALAVFDDGDGPALYVGGSFTSAGGIAANRIAKWDGMSWTPLGTGMSGTSSASVKNLTVFDGALVAAGSFLTAGGTAANRIARWNGTSWSAFASGMNDDVFAVACFDAGSGPELYAGGRFTSASGTANRIARWNGSSWSPLGSGVSQPGSTPFVGALAVFDCGDGPALYGGGHFNTAGGASVENVASWNGASWSVLESGGLDDEVDALAVFDEGGGEGPALYAGGSFQSAGTTPLAQIGRWDGTDWSSLGSGMNGAVQALAVFDDGGGPALHAGGAFTTAGGAAANRVAKWDGASWSALGTGLNGTVQALAVFDDGDGPALFAGGSFTLAGGGAASCIACWDGSSWSSLGSGVNDTVFALAVWDDGTGPALYAGGRFTSAGGAAAKRIARWDGVNWSPLGAGVETPSDSYVRALAVYDGALVAGGFFQSAGGVPANSIARWNGASWSALGIGAFHVHALAVFASELYVGGELISAGGLPPNGIARWDGAAWSPLGNGAHFIVDALAVSGEDGPDGRALYAGGAFLSTPDSSDSYLARWRNPDVYAPVLFCPTSVVKGDPLAGPPGEIVTFSVTAGDDCDFVPTVVCDPPSGSFFPRGTTIVTCTATDYTGNQSTCEFPVTVGVKVRQR